MSRLFEHVLDADREAVDALVGASVRCLPAGSSHRADFFTGTPFLIVEEGFVVIRRARGRRAVVVCHAGTGALLVAPEAGETLDALVESRVTLVTELAYAALLARPGVAAIISDALRATLRQKHDSIANFGSIHPVERVEQKLLQLAREHGRVTPNGVRLEFPITHELLAEMVGSARETVSRAIDELRDSGFVVREGRTYRLLGQPETIHTT